ncbi:MAG TPA: hypothetical protein VN654_08515 [Vicinamibacterales bacterium]|jgi:plastocyanin|nr:hypothetical protein [Vicinamibacterales bacterium]
MRFPGACVLALLFVAAGCGSSGGPAPSAVPSPGPSTPAPAPVPTPGPAAPSGTASVSITPFGLIPFEATVGVGGRVTFVNNDNLPHDIQGGPDPEHRDCPEIDVVGFLTPGQSRQTSPLMTERTCEYHDHSAQGDHHGFGGRIVIR